MRSFTPGIDACARAYAVTGNRRYAHKAAVGLFRYAETIVLVDLSEEDCYAVTLERVLGGEQHTLSWHGPDVPYRDYASVLKTDGELACLAFMRDVRRAQPKGVWALDHLLRDQGDVHLRMTMLAPEGCNLARGTPPQGRQDYEMTWAILERNGPAPLGSQFLAVIEPFRGERRFQKIEPVDGGWKLTLPLDPRIGEGFVDKCDDGTVISKIRLRFYAHWHYYAGKNVF